MDALPMEHMDDVPMEEIHDVPTEQIDDSPMKKIKCYCRSSSPSYEYHPWYIIGNPSSKESKYSDSSPSPSPSASTGKPKEATLINQCTCDSSEFEPSTPSKISPKKSQIETRLFPEESRKESRIIIEAIEQNKVNLVKEMIGKDSKYVNACHDVSKMTALHTAIRFHRYRLARKLISLGADVRARTYSGKTPLQFAVINNSHVDLVKDMIPNGSRFLKSDFYGLECLRFALEGRDEFGIKKLADQGTSNGINHYLVKTLLDSGARVNTRDHNGCSPLQCAIYTGDVELVKILIDAGADVNNKNKIGGTPLHDAVLCCNEDMVLMLLTRGAYVTVSTLADWHYLVDTNLITGHTPLHWATMFNVDCSHKRIIKYLLVFGSDLYQPEASSHSEMTGLSYILMHGDVDLVNLCVEEFKINLEQLIHGTSAALYAAQNKNAGVIDLVLKSRAKLDNNSNNVIETPLHLASQLCLVENVRKLISRGVDVNAKEIIYRYTPLNLCIKALNENELHNPRNRVNLRLINRANFAEDRSRTIKLLLESGSNLNHRFMTPKHHIKVSTLFSTAIRSDNEVRNIIVEYVAKVNAETSNKTVLDDKNLLEFLNIQRIQSHYETCRLELTAMMHTEIKGTSITYWSVMTDPMDVLARYTRNSEFIKEFETVKYYESVFPAYASWLRYKYDEAVARRLMIEKVCTFLSTTLKFADPSHVAFEIILKYLKEADICLLAC